MNTHHFDTTKEAYDACQWNEDIKFGDILVIESEGVVGVADVWPFALTEEHGDLHTLTDNTESGLISYLNTRKEEIEKLFGETIEVDIDTIKSLFNKESVKEECAATANNTRKHEMKTLREQVKELEAQAEALWMQDDIEGGDVFQEKANKLYAENQCRRAAAEQSLSGFSDYHQDCGICNANDTFNDNGWTIDEYACEYWEMAVNSAQFMLDSGE